MAGTYICDDYHAVDCPCRPTTVWPGRASGYAHCWHESVARRLEWQYGHSRVDAADIARWNALGTRKAVAA